MSFPSQKCIIFFLPEFYFFSFLSFPRTPELSLAPARPGPSRIRRRSWRGGMEGGRAGRSARMWPPGELDQGAPGAGAPWASGTLGGTGFAAAAQDPYASGDADRMPWKTPLEHGFWGEDIWRGSPSRTPAAHGSWRFVSGPPASQHEDNSLSLSLSRFHAFQERPVETRWRPTKRAGAVPWLPGGPRAGCGGTGSGARGGARLAPRRRGAGVLPEVAGGPAPTSLSFTGSDVGPDGKYPPRTQKGPPGWTRRARRPAAGRPRGAAR